MDIAPHLVSLGEVIVIIEGMDTQVSESHVGSRVGVGKRESHCERKWSGEKPKKAFGDRGVMSE